MQTTIGLPKFLSQLPLACNVHTTIRMTFSWVVMWAQGHKEKRWTNDLGFVELIGNSQEDYE